MTEHPFTLCRQPGCRIRQEPGYADRGLCLPHETQGLEHLAELPTDHTELQYLVWQTPERGGYQDTPTRTVFGPRLPINETADALAREIAYTAVVWEIAVRDQARLSEPQHRHHRPGHHPDRPGRR
jgi:hypothetical protein